MKTCLFVIGWMVLGAFGVCGQGAFWAMNGSAPTRMYSLDGPLAGPGIWGQMLVGTNTDMLAPVGVPVEHHPRGIVNGGTVIAPGIPPYSYGFAQMVAWDGTLWGSVLARVPSDQLGMTDIVPVYFTSPLPGPIFAPEFTRPAIVPVPEPAVVVWAALGASMLWLSRGSRFRPKPPGVAFEPP